MHLRRRKRKLVLLMALLLVAAIAADGQQLTTGFALRDQDRVVFFGDSITQQRLYTTYIEHYVLTRFPDRRVTFINSGWDGDQVTSNDCKPCAGTGAMARLKRDVIDRQPTVVTLLFGMNDGRYQEFDPAILKVYEDGMDRIIRQLKTNTHAPRIYAMTPTVYDPTRHTPWSKTDRYNEVLDSYSEAAKQLAAREGLSIIDLHRVTTEALRRAKEIEPSYTFVEDGVHPDENGHMIMAAEILRAWGAPLMGTVIDKQATSGAQGSGKWSLSVAAPLPWPMPPPSEQIRRARPEIMQIGNVVLKISGLPDGKYKVTVDGSNAGWYTAESLRVGLPISLLSAQAMRESRALYDLVQLRAFLYFTRWRQVEIPISGPSRGNPSLASLDALIDEITERARTLGKLHEYRLVVTRTS
jgi:lysophospholipase L1-like esterase